LLSPYGLAAFFFDEPTSLVAGELIAIWPSQICYVTILASKLPLIVLFLSGLLARFNPRFSTHVRAALSGLAFGAATYFRPVSIFLPIILWLSTLMRWKTFRSQFPMAVIATSVIGIVIAPWSVRSTKCIRSICAAFDQ